MKSRFAAGIFAFVFGGIGINNFYTNHKVAGVFDIIFAWTGIPALINVIRGCKYLWADSDEEFAAKYVKPKKEKGEKTQGSKHPVTGANSEASAEKLYS